METLPTSGLVSELADHVYNDRHVVECGMGEDCDEDPFGHNRFGMDDSGEAQGDNGATSNSMELCQAPMSSPTSHLDSSGTIQRHHQAVATDPVQASSDDRDRAMSNGGVGAVTEATQPQSAGVDEHHAGLTKSGRRKMVLDKMCEARRTRKVEAKVLARSWNGMVAAIGIDDVLSLPEEESPPPAAHPTHCLAQCGGYMGCVRCGIVVGWVGRDRLAGACRGTCPRGSVRAIRRLVKGLHPYERASDNGTTARPSGERAPVPRR